MRLITILILALLPLFVGAQNITINKAGTPIKINRIGKPIRVNYQKPGPPVQEYAYKGYSFDGVNDFVSIPQTTLNFNYTDPQSYEIWFKMNSLAGVEKTLFSMFNSSGFGTKAYISNNNYINFTIRNSSTNRILLRSQYSGGKPYIDQVMVMGRWYHLIISYDGTDANGVEFYVDGYLLGKTLQTNNLTLNPNNIATVYLGATVGGGSPSNCEIGGFRAFSKELSAAEVVTLYNKGQPLISTSVSNKVFEVLPDTIVKDIVNNVTGTVSGAILQSSDVNAIVRNGNQNFIGSALYYYTYGLAGEADSSTVIDSPFTDLRTCIYYDSVTNKTFIAWQQRPYLGGNRQSMLMAVDHTGQYATPSYQVGYESPGGYDNHGAPSVIVTPSGNVLVAHEDQHGSPIYCRRTTGKDISTGQYISTIPGAHAYPAYARIGTDIFMYTRSGTSTMRDDVTKSTDGGTTWGTPLNVLNLDNGGDVDRAYFRIVYHPTKLIYLILLREETPGLFSKIYYIESNDGITFRNITNTFSKNIVSSGTITRAEMDTNFSAIGAIGGTDIWLKCAFLTSAGLVGYTNDEINNYQFFYWSGSAWVTKPLPLPLYTPIGAAGNSGRIDAWCPYSYDLDHHVIYRIEPRNGFNVIVRYETFDRWDTWDAGTIVSDADKNHDQLQYTYNINDASKVLVAAGQLTGNATFDNNIFLYEFTP